MGRATENEIFIRDRMERDAQDFDGSGSGQFILSEREERKRRFRAVRVYVIFIFFSLVLLGFTAYQHVTELRIKSRANMVECTYNKGSYMAEARDENGSVILLKFDEFSARGNGIIKMYYFDDIRDAAPMTSVWFYVMMYTAWLLFLAGFAAGVWRTCHKSHHSAGYAGTSRFDD